MTELQLVLKDSRSERDDLGLLVTKSANRFVRRFKRSGAFGSWVSIFQRPEHLGIYSHDLLYNEGIWQGDDRLENFFFDIRHQFILCDQNDPHHLRERAFCVGFDVLSSLSMPIGWLDNNIRFNNHKADLKKGDIVIAQLQGIEAIDQSDEATKNFCRSIRAEKFATSLVCRWGRETGLGRVIILPSVINPYYSSRPTSRSKCGMIRRYDGTARSLGFKKTPTGLWVMNLQKD